VTYEEIDEELVRILSERQGSLPTHVRSVFGVHLHWAGSLGVVAHPELPQIRTYALGRIRLVIS
jgi:hypothetical protein